MINEMNNKLDGDNYVIDVFLALKATVDTIDYTILLKSSKSMFSDVHTLNTVSIIQWMFSANIQWFCPFLGPRIDAKAEIECLMSSRMAQS